jgi:endonuclease/exonuclease/phosphatase family metal-dependent hydrolase
MKDNNNVSFIIMGDFNTEPDSESTKILTTALGNKI